MLKSFSAGVSCSQRFLWPVGAALASAEIFRQARGAQFDHRRHPRVTALPLLEVRALARLKDGREHGTPFLSCLLYTSDAADDLLCVDLGGRRLIKKKTT